ncbi:MAG: hotdog fold thioesterase [Candidatus Kapaibacteriota bacterium]|jgi:acyl-CoA thioesterase
MTSTQHDIPFAKHLGIEILPASQGEAHLRVKVLEAHTNRFGTAHGGFLNALADTALEVASNSYDVQAVALTTSMQYHKSASIGAIVEVSARETHRGRSTATYHIELTTSGNLLATFTGTVFRKQPAMKLS